MKSYISIPLAAFAILLIHACTGDTEPALAVTNDAVAKHRDPTVIIENRENPYDSVGISYRDLLFAYKAAHYTPSTYDDLITFLNTMTSPFSIPSGGKPMQQLLAACTTNPDDVLVEILESSSLSHSAQNILIDFIGSYEKLGGEPFSDVYEQVRALESTVNASATLSYNDQRVILVVTAVSRYSLYHSCCEDTDWKKSVGNIVAATAGALENNNLAVYYPTVTSIAGLERIPMSN